MAAQSLSDRRTEVLAEAMTWIGTPYRHQGSTRDVGCDCLGLVVGICRKLYDRQLVIPLTYARDWDVKADNDPLLEAAREHLIEIEAADVQPGDVLVFKWSAFAPSRHLAIAAPDNTMIHAYERHSVSRSALVPSWQRRISGTFRFP